MDKELYQKLDEYYNKFGDVFPTMNYTMSFEQMIKLINKCIRLNKSIYEIDTPLKDVMY